jgi:tRNA uridine 5-carbamoylmethylation protein Kti12
MLNIKTQMHTIILLVGPSECGKTTFARQFSALAREKYNTKVAHISSDAIRMQLLCDVSESHDKSDVEMMEVSSQAFNLLRSTLECHTTWPVNTPFVIVDTTGLNEQFRESMIAYARSVNYNIDVVLFDYTWSQYTDNVPEHKHEYIRSQIKRFKQKVMPTMSRKKYNNINVVKKRDVDMFIDMDINITNIELYNKCVVPLVGEEYNGITVIGDVHESLDSLKNLVSVVPDHTLIVFIGDIIDKGSATHETISYVLELAEHRKVLFVKGNHENYVYKRIHELMPEKHIHHELETEYFTSVATLLECSDTERANFDKLHDQMLPFVKILPTPTTRSVYVAHAPQVNPRDLEKLDTHSVKNQMYLFLPHDETSIREWVTKLKEQVSGNMPFRIYGHVAHNSMSVVDKNIVMLDSGAVYGHLLTSFTMFESGRYQINQVPGLANPTPPITNILYNIWDAPRELAPVSKYALDDDDQRRLRGLIHNNIRYISGTMVPSPSEGDDIESFDAGIDYFIKAGITKLFMEPKYMGSRCQLYLFKDPDIKPYAVSRNGFKIKADGIDVLLATLNQLFAESSIEWNNSMILDGELMPWSALGRRLIDDEFSVFSECVHAELNALDNDSDWQAFDIGIAHDTGLRKQLIDVFDQQIELYGQPGPLEFKPFDILVIDDVCVVGRDPTSVVFDILSIVSTNEMDEDAMIIDLTNSESIATAKLAFGKISTVRRMEGVVLKPEVYDITDGVKCAPYMKVRNKQYLTLVYGYDYTMRNKILCETKNIRNKLRTSISEFNIGLRMLNASSDDERNNTFCLMLFELNKEKAFDPRL